MVIGQGEGHGDAISGGEEVVHPHTAVGQTWSQDRSLGIAPPLNVLAGSMDKHILGDELCELINVLCLEHSKVAADHIGIALADGIG